MRGRERSEMPLVGPVTVCRMPDHEPNGDIIGLRIIHADAIIKYGLNKSPEYLYGHDGGNQISRVVTI
jgi:hypothetical protein